MSSHWADTKAKYRPTPTRRAFLAAAAATSWTAQSWARIPGANARLRVGIIGGAKGAGELVAQLAAENRNAVQVQLAAASSIGEPLNLASGWGLRVRDRWQDVVAAKDLDGILVAPPVANRATVALAAIESAKDVYLLTPIAQRATEAASLRDAAAHHDRIVQVACTQCAQPAWNDARNQIASGPIGPLRAAFIRFPEATPTRNLAAQLHDALAPFIFATGLASPSNVTALGGRADGDPAKAPEGLLLRAEYDQPGAARVLLTASSSPEPNTRTTLRGQTTHITIEDATSPPEQSLLGEWLAAIRSRNPVRCTPTLAHHTQHTTELALQSYAQGQTLRVG